MLFAAWFVVAAWVLTHLPRATGRGTWIAVATVAIALRVAAAFLSDGRVSPGDPHWYLVLARGFLAGHGLGVIEPYMGTRAVALFPPAYPLLLASESSLADLNRRLPAPLPMNRFRPNLVVRGAPAWAEDGWKRIRIGAVELALVKPCPRCAIPSVDQETGRRTGVEPLRTLAEFRRGEEGALFGMNLVHLDRGELEVGMPVEVLA